MHTEIYTKWEQLGGSESFLGDSTGSADMCPDGQGAFAHFEGGSIHWHPETGAHETHGAIRDTFAGLNWERGFLGYPTSDERDFSQRDLYLLTKGVPHDDYEMSTVDDPEYSLPTDDSFARVSYFQEGAVVYIHLTNEMKIYKRNHYSSPSPPPYEEYSNNRSPWSGSGF